MNIELLSAALAEYGLKETPGEKDNQLILDMAKFAGFTDYHHDSIAWCSLFANFIAKKCGYERSNKLNARSWLDVGEKVLSPEMGDIVVLWRDNPTSALGHVGFLVNINEGVHYLLAGNQGDMVSVQGFQRSKVLGYRRLKKV